MTIVANPIVPEPTLPDPAFPSPAVPDSTVPDSAATVPPEPALVVTKGDLDPDRLVALAVVLLTRAVGAAASGDQAAAPLAGWRRPDRNGGYHSPHSWH